MLRSVPKYSILKHHKQFHYAHIHCVHERIKMLRFSDTFSVINYNVVILKEIDLIKDTAAYRRPIMFGPLSTCKFNLIQCSVYAL